MNFKLILLATLLMAFAVAYGSPVASAAESRSIESAESVERSSDDDNDQCFYDPLSTCTADADCAARLIYKYCISTILGMKCGITVGRK